MIGFEKLKVKYESCPDFEEMLNSRATHEIDDFFPTRWLSILILQVITSNTSVREHVVGKLHMGALASHVGHNKNAETVDINFI